MCSEKEVWWSDLTCIWWNYFFVLFTFSECSQMFHPSDLTWDWQQAHLSIVCAVSLLFLWESAIDTHRYSRNLSLLNNLSPSSLMFFLTSIGLICLISTLCLPYSLFGNNEKADWSRERNKHKIGAEKVHHTFTSIFSTLVPSLAYKLNKCSLPLHDFPGYQQRELIPRAFTCSWTSQHFVALLRRTGSHYLQTYLPG